jgi:hypothetical protein
VRKPVGKESQELSNVTKRAGIATELWSLRNRFRVQTIKGTIQWISSWLQWILFLALGAAGGLKIAKAPPGTMSAELIRRLEPEWWVPVLLYVAHALAQRLAKITPSSAWKTIHSVLDKLRAQAFPKNASGPPAAHLNRVTLFQYKPFRMRFCKYPWTGWLVPVERSGHVTKYTDTVFRAPDSGHVEGIAGEIWRSGQPVAKLNLPDVTEQSSDDDVARYAENTFVTPEWVRERIREKKLLPNHIWGVTVEVKGALWGVLVFDSRSKDTRDETQLLADLEHYKTIAACIGQILGG